MEKTILMKIIDREIPAEILYEDEQSLAILDIHPVVDGHTLVIPKNPYVNIFDIPAEELAAVIETVRIMAPAVRDAVGAKGVHVHSNHGEAADQIIPHLHFHIIPRHEKHELGAWPDHEYETPAAAKEVADSIRKNISVT